jgi:hypothetical protein
VTLSTDGIRIRHGCAEDVPALRGYHPTMLFLFNFRQPGED